MLLIRKMLKGNEIQYSDKQIRIFDINCCFTDKHDFSQLYSSCEQELLQNNIVSFVVYLITTLKVSERSSKVPNEINCIKRQYGVGVPAACLFIVSCGVSEQPLRAEGGRRRDVCVDVRRPAALRRLLPLRPHARRLWVSPQGTTDPRGPSPAPL